MRNRPLAQQLLAYKIHFISTVNRPKQNQTAPPPPVWILRWPLRSQDKLGVSAESHALLATVAPRLKITGRLHFMNKGEDLQTDPPEGP